jgi:hypothetical protein
MCPWQTAMDPKSKMTMRPMLLATTAQPEWSSVVIAYRDGEYPGGITCEVSMIVVADVSEGIEEF